MTREIVALLLIAVLLLSLPACKENVQNTHSDWVFIPSSTAMGALTENGYYYTRSDILNYADLATGTSVVLCQKPGCKHEYGLEGAAQCDAEVRIPWMVVGTKPRMFLLQDPHNLICCFVHNSSHPLSVRP